MSMVSFRRLARDWGKDCRGTAAIEFGILGPVFIAMICGVMFFGMFLYNSNRVDTATFNAARQVMLMNDPTVESVRAEVKTLFDGLALDGTSVKVSIGQRDDGGEEAVITAAYTMVDTTAFLNTGGFTHEVEYRVPLWEN